MAVPDNIEEELAIFRANTLVESVQGPHHTCFSIPLMEYVKPYAEEST
jgi:hypothetical protein